MILVTTGTNERPFDRLVRAAASLEADEPLFVQYGASRVVPGAGEWVDFLSFDELTEAMTLARVVVSHAGVGSIMLARRCGKRPIVVPRRVGLAEAVDDHQLDLARRLEQQGLVTIVEDGALLSAAVRSAPALALETTTAERGPLAAELREFLGDVDVRLADVDDADARGIWRSRRRRRLHVAAATRLNRIRG